MSKAQERADRTRRLIIEAEDLPACKTAVFVGSPSLVQRVLTLSLRCYVSEDDSTCSSREAFLRTVISRIEDDLEAGSQ